MQPQKKDRTETINFMSAWRNAKRGVCTRKPVHLNDCNPVLRRLASVVSRWSVSCMSESTQSNTVSRCAGSNPAALIGSPLVGFDRPAIPNEAALACGIFAREQSGSDRARWANGLPALFRVRDSVPTNRSGLLACRQSVEWPWNPPSVASPGRVRTSVARKSLLLRGGQFPKFARGNTIQNPAF